MRRIWIPRTLALVLLLPSTLLVHTAHIPPVAAARPAGSDVSLPLAQQPPCPTPELTVQLTPEPTVYPAPSDAPPAIKQVSIAQDDCVSPTPETSPPPDPSDPPETSPPPEVSPAPDITPTPDCVNYPCITPTATPDCVNYPCITPTATPDCVNYPCVTPTEEPIVTPLPTVEPSATPLPPTATPAPRQAEPEPQTNIVSIELQVANGKIWGLLVAENPRAGRSVTLRLNSRATGPGTQQASNDGFTPTGQTTTIVFADDQTSYNFSFDKPSDTPEDAEYRVDVESSDGDVGGTDSTSLPVSFDRPSPEPTATAQAPVRQATPVATTAPPTATPATLNNIQNPQPTATQAPAGAAAAQPDTAPQVLPTTGASGRLPALPLAAIALGLLAAAWLIRQQRRPRSR